MLHGTPAALASALAMIGSCAATEPPAQTVTLDVTFRLTDPNYAPIANAPVMR